MSDDPLGWLGERQRDGGIDRVRLPPGTGGSLWLCGKHAVVSRFDNGTWDSIVCLVERHELAGRYPDYLAWLDAGGDRVRWFPIPDLHAPGVEAMHELVDDVIGRLDAGERVLVHCGAGKGRAGTTAVCVLVRLGMAVVDALDVVAAGRPGAGPEAGIQRDLVQRFAESG